ncbi:SRPBCC family protein [Devosia nitrariae]|uniref:Activator of Hsp90 ATPase homologue 1/2-like C-terminal domain-containing protein n=1 Tax=Devosia nitrariae TaxID=2071872 RepID=A0ABQ5W393_9HYPH|nr:SRPBCC domain-containing protein [Devosia nitrariae]GLQ54390.1 hypothetical protein GCM10010862_16490 [Devosia nitrariae]
MNETTQARASHRFRASAGRGFDAWIDPNLIGRWLFVTSPAGLAQVHVDARENGQYILVDRRDGKDVIHCGAYLVIERPRRLVLTVFVPEHSRFTVRVEVTITPAEDGCVVDLVSEVGNDQLELRDQLAEGWRDMLAHLDTVIPAAAVQGDPQ